MTGASGKGASGPPADLFFWYVAQTGVLHDVPPGGNFYAYRIRSFYRSEVEALSERAKLGSGGFDHAPSDLLRLEELDLDREEDGYGRSNRLPRRARS